MPTWTVERNCAGSLASSSAAFAAVIAFLGALLQPHLPGRDHGNLRHGEDAVGEHEQEDDDDLGPMPPIRPFYRLNGLLGWPLDAPAGPNGRAPAARIVQSGRTMLTLDNVRKSYRRHRGGRRTVARRVARGEVLGLLGPNGAGKSTTRQSRRRAAGAGRRARSTIDGHGNPRDTGGARAARRRAAGAGALRPADRRGEPALLRRGLRPVGRGAGRPRGVGLRLRRPDRSRRAIASAPTPAA